MSAATKQQHTKPDTRPVPPTTPQPSLWVVYDARSGRGRAADVDAVAAYGPVAPAPAPLSSSSVLSLAHDPYAWARACPLLSAEQERTLAKRMRSADTQMAKAAREKLFESGARWAFTIARWHATVRAPLDDLAQVAWMALWQALPSFDPSCGRLTTHVAYAILRDVRRAVDEMSSPIRRPVYVVDAERREWRFVTRYEAEHGHEPSDELLAAALDAPAQVVRQVVDKQARRRPVVVSLDAPQSVQARSRAHAFDATIAETIPSEDIQDDPEEMAARSERSERVASFVAHDAKLTAREQQVLALFYSDDRQLANNLAAIARVLGMSRERVRQIHDHALSKLRRANTRSGGALSALYAEMDS